MYKRQEIAAAYHLEQVEIHAKVVRPVSEASGGKKDSGEIIMGGAIKGAVQPMTGLNPKMGSVIVAGRVFFADMYETRRPGVFCLTFDMTDFQTSVRVTKYMQKEEKEALKKDIKPEMCIRDRRWRCGPWRSPISVPAPSVIWRRAG